MSKQRSNSRSQGSNNQLRMIGGQWRGRKLPIPNVAGLRPTPDRVRETLFNWLSTAVAGSRCLDLFSGSGALGLEALSRGAAHVDLVDQSPLVYAQLQQNLATLNASPHASVWQACAEQWLAQYTADRPRYDVIFLDPPFHQGLLTGSIQLIDQQQLLTPHSWVYIESDRDEPAPITPASWQLHREKNAGQVCYRLYAIATQNGPSTATQV